jgi:hypothetical protein
MTYSTRFYNIIISITAVLIFYLWNVVSVLNFENDFIRYLIILLTSYGSFKFLVIASIFLTKRIRILKRFFLGNAYLEGTWVGFYIGVDGQPRYFREVFEQELDYLLIRGRSNDENNLFHTSWKTSIVNIDIKNAKLSYMYEISSIHEKSDNKGLAFFDLDRNNQLEPPHKMIGYSTDLHIGERIKSYSVRLSNKTDITFEDALKKAIEIYTESKGTF